MKIKFHNLHPLFPLIGFLLGLMVWLIDAAVDTYLINYDRDGNFIDNIFLVPGTELWMRALVVMVFVGFGFLTRYIYTRQLRIEAILRKQKNNLEELIEARSSELKLKNLKLEEEIQRHKWTEKELERMATTDTLTHLYNRRKLNSLLHKEAERAQRYHSSLSLIICDIDHFKDVNDVHGHLKGDDVLKEIAHLLLESIRNTDIVGRWGGEEFLVIVPMTHAREALLLAENLRKAIASHDFSKINQITMSCGVCQYQNHEDINISLARADKALYEAKANGRNRCELAT